MPRSLLAALAVVALAATVFAQDNAGPVDLSPPPAPPPPPTVASGDAAIFYRSAYVYKAPPRKRPPPFRPPPKAPSTPVFVHSPDLSELLIKCPLSGTEGDVPTIDRASCTAPTATVAAGVDAEEIRVGYGLNNGDLVNVTLGDATETGQARHRMMLNVYHGRDLYDGLEEFSEETQDRIMGSRRRSIMANARRLSSAAPPPTRRPPPKSSGGSKKPLVTVKLTGLGIKKAGGQKEIYTGTPIRPRTFVFIMDFTSCTQQNPTKASGTGWRAATTVAAVERAVKSEISGAFANNLGTQYEACSYRKTEYSSDNFIVLGPVPVTCIGGLPQVWPGPAPPRPPPRSTPSLTRRNATYTDWWDLSNFCTASEQQYIERAADAWVNQTIATLRAQGDNAGANRLNTILTWGERRRNIYILPSSAQCPWAGYGDVTCTSRTCSAYSRGFGTDARQVFFHESMHNYGLEHASTPGDEYGDPTDIMGKYDAAISNGGLICPNAPNMYRIGWASPIANVTVEDFKIAGFEQTLTYTIPAAGTSDVNYVKVMPYVPCIQNRTVPSDGCRRRGALATAVDYYISFRIKNTTANGFDSGLSSFYQSPGKVVVHSYAGFQSERLSNGVKPVKVADLNVNGVWRSPFIPITVNADGETGGQIVVTVKSISGTTATVDVRRLYPEDCGDGLDNDGNGFVDEADCACGAGTCPPPPSPPRPTFG